MQTLDSVRKKAHHFFEKLKKTKTVRPTCRSVG